MRLEEKLFPILFLESCSIFTVGGAAHRRQTILDRRLANTSGDGGGEGAPGRISRGFEPKTFSLDK